MKEWKKKEEIGEKSEACVRAGHIVSKQRVDASLQKVVAKQC